MSESISESITWSPVLEAYFAETGEKAAGRAWLHAKAETLYGRRRTWIDLPVAIGSGAIAFLNAGSTSLFEDAKMASIYLGIASFVVGTMNTVGSYFGWAKRSEGHRIAALSYAKLHRFLRVELGLPRTERMRPGDLLKMIKQEIDRLAETSPPIPEQIKNEFRQKFKTAGVAKPEETNGLDKVIVFDRDSNESFAIRPDLVLRSPDTIRRQPSTAALVETPAAHTEGAATNTS